MDQISEIVVSLRNFARLDRAKVANFNLNEGLQSTLRIARHEVKRHTVEEQYGDIPTITCSPSQINQVLLNLINHAAQSIESERGLIRLTTRREDDSHVAVEIEDNGKGIPPDVLSRIFDPFFTPKDPGKGTGLGLSISHRIVEQHGGRITVDSAVGIGTKFRVVLPLQSAARGTRGLNPCPRREYVGKYRVEGVLGQGGMGTVYRAFDSSIHRQVAIKTVNKGALDPVNLQYALMRFRHEAQAVGRLTHPRIAAIYDYGEDTGDRLHRDGAGERQVALPAHAGTGALRAEGDRGDHPPAPRRAGLRARAGGRAPRHQALEHPGERRRAHQDQRFRHSAHRFLDPDAGGRDHGLARLHGAGAVPRHRDRRVQRHLLRGHHRLRAGGRETAFCREQSGNHAGRAERPAAQPVGDQPADLGAARLGGAEGARQEQARPLPGRPRVFRGVPERHRGRAYALPYPKPGPMRCRRSRPSA